MHIARIVGDKYFLLLLLGESSTYPYLLTKPSQYKTLITQERPSKWSKLLQPNIPVLANPSQKATIFTSISALLLMPYSTVAHPLSPRQNATYTTAMVSYVADYSCGTSGTPFLDFPSTITSGVCVKFLADSYKITPLPDVKCTFSTFNGNGCVPANLDRSHIYKLDAGAGDVCAFGGVPDGGLHYLRSGLLTCP